MRRRVMTFLSMVKQATSMHLSEIILVVSSLVWAFLAERPTIQVTRVSLQFGRISKQKVIYKKEKSYEIYIAKC